jgi:PadR family transcriptional regulator, regulatory protein PadR
MQPSLNDASYNVSRPLMRKKTSISSELLPGTLEMLILKTLTRGSAHGYGIARHLERTSADVLQVGESSLYPALQRLLINGWVTAEWGETDQNRRARFYRITPAGRKRLAAEAAGFERVVGAIGTIMQAG